MQHLWVWFFSWCMFHQWGFQSIDSFLSSFLDDNCKFFSHKSSHLYLLLFHISWHFIINYRCFWNIFFHILHLFINLYEILGYFLRAIFWFKLFFSVMPNLLFWLWSGRYVFIFNMSVIFLHLYLCYLSHSYFPLPNFHVHFKCAYFQFFSNCSIEFSSCLDMNSSISGVHLVLVMVLCFLCTSD